MVNDSHIALPWSVGFFRFQDLPCNLFSLCKHTWCGFLLFSKWTPNFRELSCNTDDLKSWSWDVHSSVKILRSVTGAVSPACTAPMLLLPWEVWGRGLGTSSETLLLFSLGHCDIRTKLGKPNIVAVLKLLCGVRLFLHQAFAAMWWVRSSLLGWGCCLASFTLPYVWSTSVTRGAVPVAGGWDCFGAVGSNAQLQQTSGERNRYLSLGFSLYPQALNGDCEFLF